jgi:hypothetical protein
MLPLWLKKRVSASAAVSDAIVFLSFFFSVWLWVDPSINYYYPGFWRDHHIDGYTAWFLAAVPFYPGKPVNWLVSILAPGFAGALSGALILTAIAWALALLCERLLLGFGVKNGWGWKYIPMVILFLQFFYMVNSLAMVISTIIGLTFAWFYQVAGGWKAGMRSALFIFFSVIVFIAAFKAFLIFVLLCMLYVGMVRRRLLCALTQAAIGAVIPMAITLILFPLYVSAEMYRNMLPFLSPAFSIIGGILPLVYWLFFPGMAAIALIEKRAGHRHDGKQRKTSRFARFGMARGMLPGALAVLTTSILLFTIRDPIGQARSNAIMNSAMLSRNWDLLINEAERVPKQSLTKLKVHIINRALYHKGRLLEDFFKYPQSQSTLLPFPFSGTATAFTTPVERFWTAVWSGWTYYELGLVNIAEHCALEAASQFYYPEGMRLLSMIYFAKDMPDAGRTCLNALQKDRVYRPWAKKSLNTMERTPEIQTIRSYILKSAPVGTEIVPLKALLEQNPNNKMAFEYLIATHLGQRTIDSLDQYIDGLRALNYGRIPRLFEEALLLNAYLTKKEPDLRGYTISNETYRSFNEFFTILEGKHGGSKRDAYRELVDTFGDSYFFYYVYGFSKAMANDKKN